MARDPYDVYDDWYLNQEEKLDALIDKIHDTDDPRKKLKNYDNAIAKAEVLVKECLERESSSDGLYPNSQDAERNYKDIIDERERYLAEEYDDDLAEFLEMQKEEREAAKEAALAQKKRNAAKEKILAALMAGKQITLVELEKTYPDFKDVMRDAAQELDKEDGRIEHFKIKNRIAVRMKTDEGTVGAETVAKIKAGREPKNSPQQSNKRSQRREYEETNNSVLCEEKERIQSGFADFAAKEKSLSGSEKKPEGKGSTFLLTAIIFAVIVYFVFF
jgi:hypothetical protein